MYLLGIGTCTVTGGYIRHVDMALQDTDSLGQTTHYATHGLRLNKPFVYDVHFKQLGLMDRLLHVYVRAMEHNDKASCVV